jgi:nicotinamidase-related amidase
LAHAGLKLCPAIWLSRGSLTRRKTADNVSYVKLARVETCLRRGRGRRLVATAVCDNERMTSGLLLIDAQRNMLEGEDAVPSANQMKDALSRLLDSARAAEAVVVHVQNDGPPGSPDEPHTDGWELVFPPDAGELVVRKEESDTFASNPGLAASLRDRGVDRVVVAGMQSEFCVEATSRGALGEGFVVLLPRGGHATYDDETSAAEVSLASEEALGAEGVEIVNLDQVEFG